MIESGYQLFFIWSDWALPIRISVEKINEAIEIQLFCFFFVFWRREVSELSININKYSNGDED